MERSNHLPSRRTFVKGAAAVAGLTILPSRIYAGPNTKKGKLVPPSQKVNVACIGAGGRAGGVIPNIAGGGANIYALCDIDHRRAGGLMRRYSNAQKFTDFRKMLDKIGDNIDAVTVVVPDHMHFCAAILAMSMGKHVYVEKPLTHTFHEAELLMKAEKKFGVVTQMGNQGHTSSGSNQFKTWVENGIIKDVTRADVWKTASLWFMNRKQRIHSWPTGETKPDYLDWNLWCGPMPMKPYSGKLHPFNWRGFYLYGCGMLGDWGAHLIDFIHDYLRLGLPTEIEALKMVDHNQVIFPLETRLKFKFPARGPGMPAMDLYWSDGGDCKPKLDERKYGKVKIGGAGKVLYGKDLTFIGGSHGSTSNIIPYSKMRDLGAQLKVPNKRLNHFHSFVRACKGEEKTWSPFRVSGKLTQVLMLGCIAQYLNRNLKFDPNTKAFIGDDEANHMLKGPKPRDEWLQYYNLV